MLETSERAVSCPMRSSIMSNALHIEAVREDIREMRSEMREHRAMLAETRDLVSTINGRLGNGGFVRMSSASSRADNGSDDGSKKYLWIIGGLVLIIATLLGVDLTGIL